MQPRVKDDVLQKHPNVNDAPFSFVSPWCLRLFDRSHLSSADTMWLQGDAVVRALQEFQITRRAVLDLHIQILQSNLVLLVGLFHNRDLGFVSVSPLTIFLETDRPFSAASSTVSNLLGGGTKVQLFSIALAFVIYWLLSSQVYFEWSFRKAQTQSWGFMAIFLQIRVQDNFS